MQTVSTRLDHIAVNVKQDMKVTDSSVSLMTSAYSSWTFVTSKLRAQIPKKDMTAAVIKDLQEMDTFVKISMNVVLKHTVAVRTLNAQTHLGRF